jgi:hypothetical protein
LKKLILIVFLVITLSGFSQKTTEQQSVWFSYVGQYKTSKNWGYHLEAQFRMDGELGRSYQNLFRVGGIYYLPNKKSVSGGYCMVQTYNGKVDDYLNENRYWEQFQLSDNWKKNSMIHRFRMEQRFVEKLNSVTPRDLSTEYQNRFRYLNRNLFHIAELNSAKEELYAVLQNEVFLNVGDNKLNKHIVDQNRFLVGLGLKYQNNIRMELGYMNHYITSSTSADLMRHTISLSLSQNLDFYKD